MRYTKLFLIVMLFSFVSFAQEVAGGGDTGGKILTFLMSDVGLSLIGLVAAGVGTYLRKVQLKNEAQQRAMDCLASGVVEVEESFVAPIKAAGTSLTPEQRAEAQRLAIEAAKKKGTEVGVNITKILAPHLIELGVKAAVNKFTKHDAKLPADVQAALLQFAKPASVEGELK